ncbi:Integral membrane protein TerC family protein [Paraliobacillus sp. PM-2]|uniref:TerC family protein n=1 Tax=Paraliobacillus sp. PM-2 TaxID=1462524 RepID=UPI00061C49AB|nr:TerC family protein [Paraliobacillus sp. PM-2]CQR47944.1 Integral membrane protein TerC family protein [Paraliobacillus sp. PM-2]
MELITKIITDFSSLHTLSLLQIIMIDIILSGDNAVVIAMATKSLPKEKQNKAIFLGTAGAVILRICFATVIIFLLKIPYIHAFGGILLLWIAYQLLVEKEEKKVVHSHPSIFRAITTIIVADAVMSLDNVVAITGAANGNILLIVIGVAISIPIMIFGSKLIVALLNKYRFVIYFGSGILAWTAGDMIMTDQHFIHLLQLTNDTLNIVLINLLTIATLLVGYIRSDGTGGQS